VKIHKENIALGEMKIKEFSFRFLSKMLKFDLISFVGIKS
jgi:hypothetical protein